jgi:hypothetical protein
VKTTVLTSLVQAQNSAAAIDEIDHAIVALRRAQVYLESAGRFPDATRAADRALKLVDFKQALQRRSLS